MRNHCDKRCSSLSILIGNPPAFLQCGEWVFPLVPGKSPVLKAADTTYMFPELQGDGRLIIFVTVTLRFVTIYVIATLYLCNM